MKYECTNCESDLSDEEAIHQTMPMHLDAFNGSDPPVFDIVKVCPLCGCIDCVREKTESEEEDV